jgi:hypothetical protein
VELLATRLFRAQEQARDAEQRFARGDAQRSYWRFMRDGASANTVMLWDLASLLGPEVESCVVSRLGELHQAKLEERDG